MNPSFSPDWSTGWWDPGLCYSYLFQGKWYWQVSRFCSFRKCPLHCSPLPLIGAKERQEIMEAFCNIYPILKKFKKTWSHTTSYHLTPITYSILWDTIITVLFQLFRICQHNKCHCFKFCTAQYDYSTSLQIHSQWLGRWSHIWY